MVQSLRLLACKLSNKSILRLSGSDSLPYLQTFITNDIRHVAPGSGKHCIYAFLPNSMGRVLADLFVYQPCHTVMATKAQRNLVLAPFYSDDFGLGCPESDQVLVECSSKLAGGLSRNLFAMKIRKKVDIEILENRQVWVFFPADDSQKQLMGSIPTQVASETISVPDPRLPGLAHRVVTTQNNLDDISRIVFGNIPIQVSRSKYTDYCNYRYKHGIAEGVYDMPEGFPFPLELNADFLRGISFKKGMFSGDWITGRNYRKGVQNRVVPFCLDYEVDQEVKDQIAPDTALVLRDGEIAVVRGMSNDHGIAMVSTRVWNNNFECKFKHEITGVTGKCWIPEWWPHFEEFASDRMLPDGKNPAQIIPRMQR